MRTTRRSRTALSLLSAAWLLLAAVGVPGATSPQGSATTQTPPQAVFRAGVDLVTIDVIVVDKDGRPVKGLAADDFIVRLEDQPRPVRAIDFLAFGSTRGPERVATTRQTNNQSASAGRGRVFVLVFDDLSYRQGRGKAELTAAERMISKFADDDLIGFATTSGLGPAINPTRDRSVVIAALRDKRLIGRYDDDPVPFLMTVNEAIEIDRGISSGTLQETADRECPRLQLDPDICVPMIQRHARGFVQQSIHRTASQLAAYRQLIQALRRAPAPRVLVAFTRGLAVGADVDVKSLLDPISRAAAESQLQFYALSGAPDDVDVSTPGPPDGVAPARPYPLLQTARRDEARFLTSGIQTVASAAGGAAFVVAGTPDRFLQRIELETSALYRLGVEAPVLTGVRQFAATTVSVRQPGLTVHVNRQAFMASAAPESLSIEERLRAALAQEGTATGVPIALAGALRRNPGSNEPQLAVNVEIPPSVPGPLVAMFGLVDTMGSVVQAGRKDVPVAAAGNAYQLAFPVPLSPGASRLRFVVADGQGNVGSVEHRLAADFLHLGAFTASDLLASWTGANSRPRFLALETLPDDARSLTASVELYPDDPARVPEVAVRIALLPAGKETAIFEREVVPQIAGSTRIASAQIPVADLGAGSYLLRAAIVERGTTTGTVSMALRKTGAASPASPENNTATLMHFRHWLDLARQHIPGQLDEAVREVRQYSVTRLEGLRGDLEALTTMLRNPYETRTQRIRDYSDAERRVLQDLAFDELSAHTDNRLLRGIALLHTDAAVLPGATPYLVEQWATTRQGVSVSQDGVPVGVARLAPHLPIARAALAAMFPRPADDPWVHAWYRATTAHLFYAAQIVALPDHLADRRRTLPGDPETAFAEGCLFEVYSSDEIQAAAQAARARGGRIDVPSRREALLRARQLFLQIGLDAPDYAEARVRLARINLRLDDARAAAEEIDAWLRVPGRAPDLRYYAYLVLGAARWSLGDAKAAAGAYEEALRLYPSAQSAVVALLLVRPGAAIEGDSPMLNVLRRPAGERTDPWSDYGIGPGRQVETLIRAVWKSAEIR